MKLIKYELRKLFMSKAFYIIGILELLFILIYELINKSTYDGLTLSISLLNSIFYSNIVMLSAIAIPIFISADYQTGAIKNIITKGYKKSSIYFSKYLVVELQVIIYYFLSLLFSFIIGNIFYLNDFSINLILPLFIELIGVIAYTTIFFVISIIFLKASVGITINVITPIAIELIFMLLTTSLKMDTKITKLWLEGIIQTFRTLGQSPTTIIYSIVMSLIYQIVFLIIGLINHNKKEF